MPGSSVDLGRFACPSAEGREEERLGACLLGLREALSGLSFLKHEGPGAILQVLLDASALLLGDPRLDVRVDVLAELLQVGVDAEALISVPQRVLEYLPSMRSGEDLA